MFDLPRALTTPEPEIGVDAVREAVEAVAAERAHAGASFSVDVDPQ